METRSIAVFAALLLVPCCQILAQNGDLDQSADCIDYVSGAMGDCAQNSQQTSPDILGSGTIQTPQTGRVQTSRPAARISPATESAPLSSDIRTQAQERRLLPEPPTEFQKFVAATIGQWLPIYGADLFRNVPTTFAPSDLAPAMPEYVIGPDDELRIRIWGQVEYSGNLRVDRSGNIFIPQVGAVHVAGLQFSALDGHVREAVGKMYRNFDLSVDLGRIRSMQIYVTGQARRPGVYTVSSLSSLVNVLFASGGPSSQGSLRHIYVKRDGKTLSDFDLYALLVSGDKSHDVRLLPEDVIYIPPVGPQVAIVGSIRVPGIYELNSGETIGDLIDFAGKTTAMASSTRLSLERIKDRDSRAAMEVDFNDQGLRTQLLDGDILRVFPVLPAYSKTVTLRGYVANPGRFSWHPGMRLSDVIPDRNSLVSREYWWRRSHLGLPGEEFEPIVSTNSIESQRTDISAALQTRTSRFSNDSPNASQSAANSSLASEVRQEASQNLAGAGKTNDVILSDLGINWNYAVIERMDPTTLKTSLIPFDLGKLVVDHDASQNLPLEPGDAITVFSQADIRVPLAEQTKYVKLEGEFVHAGVYSVRPGETLRDLVQRAGGLTKNAYLFGAEFTRQSTRILQQQRLDEYVRSVRMEAERGTQALAVSGASGGSTAADLSASRAATEQLMSRLSQIRATGRIVLEFRPGDNNLREIPRLDLQNGDHFTVPSAPDYVNVIGAVYDQNSFIYRRNRPVSYYLKLAGGPNRNADKKHSFLLRADGSVISRSEAKNGWSYLGGNAFDDLRLYPGDTIMVPDKTLRPTALRGFMDWTQVFSQMALGAAAINVIH